MTLFPIAASDMDLIIGIIAVVGWVVAQLFSKKKSASPHQEESPPESGAPIDPRAELRKFFDELEKTAKQPTAPRPVAPTPPPHKQHKEKAARRSHEPRMETLSSQSRPAYPASESARVFTGIDAPVTFTRTLPIPAHGASMPELRNPVALRKLIIANEILGKPIALRQN